MEPHEQLFRGFWGLGILALASLGFGVPVSFGVVSGGRDPSTLDPKTLQTPQPQTPNPETISPCS